MEDTTKTTQTDGTSTTVTNEGKDGDQSQSKTFNQDQLNDVVSKRVKEEQTKFEKITQEKIDAALTEERRVAKLSADEKEKEIARKQNEELSKKERELTLRENKLSGIEKLNTNGLPIKFIDFVLSEDVDAMDTAIGSLKTTWDEEVAAEVAKQITGGTPKAVNTNEVKKDQQAKPEGTNLF